MSRLRLLTTKFENLRMNEDKSIFDFNIRLRDIGNTFFPLEEKVSKKSLQEKSSDPFLRILI